jgi:hypothetical protein
MAEPTNDAELSYEQYSTEFVDTSLGTEEELSDTTIRTALGAGQLIGYVQKYGEPLVQITKDLQVAEDHAYGEYTIELRTTPTELIDEGDWKARRRALQVAIWAIEVRHGGKALASETWRGYETVIINTDHQIMKVPNGGVARAGRQSTVGVPAAGIGAGASLQDRAVGRLCSHVALPWYRDEFTADQAVATLPARQQIGYALVMSAIQQLATIWLDYPGALSLLNAKNAWTVRPRTPPVRILHTFDQDELDTALNAILNRPAPSEKLATQWEAARAHIVEGRPMGGHPLPDSAINGQQAMLFEYRTAPYEEYPHAFWKKGELTDKDFPEQG